MVSIHVPEIIDTDKTHDVALVYPYEDLLCGVCGAPNKTPYRLVCDERLLIEWVYHLE